MLRTFVLGSAVSGGLLVLGLPLAFGSLLSLRYPEQRVSAPKRRADESRAETADKLLQRHEAAPPAQQPGHGSVVGPERLESLRASRERLRASSSPHINRAA